MHLRLLAVGLVSLLMLAVPAAAQASIGVGIQAGPVRLTLRSGFPLLFGQARAIRPRRLGHTSRERHGNHGTARGQPEGSWASFIPGHPPDRHQSEPGEGTVQGARRASRKRRRRRRRLDGDLTGSRLERRPVPGSDHPTARTCPRARACLPRLDVLAPATDPEQGLRDQPKPAA